MEALLPLRRAPASLLNGLTIGAGLLLLTGAVFPLAGPAAAIAASSGYGSASVADVVCPPRGKALTMSFAVLGVSLVGALVHLAHGHAWATTAVVLGVTCFGLLWGAWGKRGLPQSFAMILSLIFQMAAARSGSGDTAAQLAHVGWVVVGAVAMAAWALLTNRWLAPRNRVLALAESLMNLSRMVRTQAAWTRDRATPDSTRSAQHDLLALIRQQAALADVFQSARDLIYDGAEATADPERRRQVDTLIHVINLRDTMLACQLDIDELRLEPATRAALLKVAGFLNWQADQVAAWSECVRLGRPLPAGTEPPMLLAPDDDRPLQSLARRAHHLRMQGEALRAAMASHQRGPHPQAPGLHSLISPTGWSLAPLRRQLNWRSPTLRYALRATLAMACALALSQVLPWHTHPHWLLLTVAVVMRGNLEQTLARRDARIVGTIAGCALGLTLLAAQPGLAERFLVLALSMAVAHAYVVRDYRVTTTAAAVMALIQANLLADSGHAVWQDAAERLADTLIGAAIAWGFSYVLPAWEKGQLPGLVRHLRHTMGRYGHHVLQWQEAASPLLERTQTRREVYDAIWLLAQALQRTAREPGYAGSWSPQLEALLLRSHRLIGLLAVVRIVLIHRRDDLHGPTAMAAVERSRTALRTRLADAHADTDSDTSAGAARATAGLDARERETKAHGQPAADLNDTGSIQSLPAPQGDPTPWLAHRLDQIAQEAHAWAQAAHEIERRR